MGRNSGGNRDDNEPSLEQDSNYKGSIKNKEDLSAIKDKKLFKETKSAIARFDSVLGVRERQVMLADLRGGTMGVQVSQDGENAGVYLNKKYFKNKTYKQARDQMKKIEADGWLTKTNKYVAHTVTHELGHALWNSDQKNTKSKQAGVEISKMYNQWKKDTNKTGYGKYASANIDEFWAETVAKAVHGTADKYTKKLKKIVKRYNL